MKGFTKWNHRMGCSKTKRMKLMGISINYCIRRLEMFFLAIDITDRVTPILLQTPSKSVKVNLPSTVTDAG